MTKDALHHLHRPNSRDVEGRRGVTKAVRSEANKSCRGDRVVPHMSAEVAHPQRITAGCDWEQRHRELRKTYKLRNFKAAIAFVNSVADIAEDAGHHPDIDIRWNRVTLTLSTHSAGALTNLDFEVAKRIEDRFTDDHSG